MIVGAHAEQYTRAIPLGNHFAAIKEPRARALLLVPCRGPAQRPQHEQRSVHSTFLRACISLRVIQSLIAHHRIRDGDGTEGTDELYSLPSSSAGSASIVAFLPLGPPGGGGEVPRPGRRAAARRAAARRARRVASAPRRAVLGAMRRSRRGRPVAGSVLRL